MEYLQIFNKALTKLKSLYDLPSTGFLTGGSLANLIWEEVSGNRAEINDIDIFIISEVVSNYDHVCKITSFTNTQHEKVIFEDYKGLNYRYDSKITYLIEKATNRDIFNEIYYSSTTKDPQIIIDSFDINCCQVGFNLSEQKFYWTKDFLEFLQTGKLKITDLSTPAHTAIRLAKKMTQLGTNCDKIEFDIIKYAIKHKHIIGTSRFRFKEKYKLDFERYKSILENDFILIQDKETEEKVAEKYGVSDSLFYLDVNNLDSFHPHNTIGISLPKEYMFYMRNILGKKKLEELWVSLHFVIDNKLKFENYFDCSIKDSELSLLKKLLHVAPKCIQHLRGYSLSEQVSWVNQIVDKFKHDPIIAISVIEETPIQHSLDLDDEMTLLLLELSVRKKIVDEKNRKAEYIFGCKKEVDFNSNKIIDFPF